MSDLVHADDEGQVSIERDSVVSIHAPERITMLMYRQYSQEREKYVDRCIKAKVFVVEQLADYHAARALVRDYPYFKVDGPPEFMRLLDLGEDEYDKLDADFVSVILYGVAYPVKGSVNDFLRDKPRWTVQTSKNGTSPGTS